MKIRILDNSIRLRLSQQEVGQLANGTAITGQVTFPDGSNWKYGLQSIEQETLFSVIHSSTGIEVKISQSGASELVDPGRVGHSSSLTTPYGDLKILVEKDFKCLTSREEDESGLYENPKAVC